MVGDEGDKILDFLIGALKFRALILSLKKGHLFDWSALVRVLNWDGPQVMVLIF